MSQAMTPEESAEVDPEQTLYPRRSDIQDEEARGVWEYPEQEDTK